MTDPAPVVDLGALSARLRQDDREFRRTFALGCLADAGDPATPVRGEPVGDREHRARLMALIEARTGIASTGSGGAATRLDRLLAALPAALVPVWLLTLEAGPMSGPEWEAVIAGVTVQETYFFRDPDQLSFLSREVLAKLVAARRHERTARLSCWCAGCATGEEVYSLAILIVEALRAAGEAEIRPDGGIVIHPRWRIAVLGTDIDRAALHHAQAGRYLDFAMGPFRSLPETLAGYFETMAEEAPPGRPARPVARVVARDIRALSNFRLFNLTKPEPPVEDVDLILCRNVLIYLSDRVRRHAQDLFHRALAYNGHLALGPTDTLKTRDLFLALWGPDTVLYRKR